MAKYKEIVSMVLDMLKKTSDDSLYTEEHIIFLAGRYRSFLLKQRYLSDTKKQIPESAYQTLCLSLEPTEAIEGYPCEGGYYLASTEKVPDMLPCGTPKIFSTGSYYIGDIAFVSKDRMRYVGYSKWMKNIIYACLDPSGKIYMHSSNPQFLYMNSVSIRGVFENAEEASELECNTQNNEDACDILDRDFPLEDALVAPLIELIVQELSPSLAIPKDDTNNAADDSNVKK